MKIKEFEQIVKTKKKAEHYLTDLCNRMGPLKCIKCGCEKLYSIEKGRRKRCSTCGYTFHTFTGRWINRSKIGAREWLWIIKLFELETPASVITKETSISYPTVLKSVTVMRMALAHPGNGNGHSNARGYGAIDGEIYGMIGNEHERRLEPISKDHIILLARIKDESFVLLDRSANYDSLMYNGRQVKIAHQGRNYLNYMVYCSVQGFWQYATEKLIKFHGVSYDRLPIYLKEVEFRWCNRNVELFELLVERICDYMPGSLIHEPEPG